MNVGPVLTTHQHQENHEYYVVCVKNFVWENTIVVGTGSPDERDILRLTVQSGVRIRIKARLELGYGLRLNIYLFKVLGIVSRLFELLTKPVCVCGPGLLNLWGR